MNDVVASMPLDDLYLVLSEHEEGSVPLAFFHSARMAKAYAEKIPDRPTPAACRILGLPSKPSPRRISVVRFRKGFLAACEVVRETAASKSSRQPLPGQQYLF